jgi:hypothetical protein
MMEPTTGEMRGTRTTGTTNAAFRTNAFRSTILWKDEVDQAGNSVFIQDS